MRKLGVAGTFSAMPDAQRFWLEKRDRAVKELVPSTYQSGIDR
jgi:hypothetical protein